jgi:uncharacterized protein YecE (DUF72 family)
MSMSAPARADRTPRIGTAGWALPAKCRDQFPASGSHLERYAQRFNAAEINSSFRKRHRRSTYERWAASVPDDFAFSAKIPKEITHTRRLSDAASPLDAFLDEVAGLGPKLAVLLVQLPPSLHFEVRAADAFLTTFRARFTGNVALEPRHASWFAPTAEELLIDHWTARVAADPAILPEAAEPGGWPDVRYYRLHGSPRMYYSRYEADRISVYAERIKSAGRRAWCIFDNTVEAAATENALELSALLG